MKTYKQMICESSSTNPENEKIYEEIKYQLRMLSINSSFVGDVKNGLDGGGDKKVIKKLENIIKLIKSLK